MTVATNAENLRLNEIGFPLIVELILAFPSGTNMIREVKNLSPYFKQIT